MVDMEKNDVKKKKQTGFVVSHFQQQGYNTFMAMQNVVMLMENNRQAHADPRYAKCLLNSRYVCWPFGDWAESCMIWNRTSFAMGRRCSLRSSTPRSFLSTGAFFQSSSSGRLGGAPSVARKIWLDTA
jgi:hypothetical protein